MSSEETPRRARTITLSGDESYMLLEALAGLYARSGTPKEVTAALRLAQRIEGFDIDGSDGAVPVEENTPDGHATDSDGESDGA